MKLAGKTLLGIAITLAGFIIIFAIIADTVIVASYEDLEEQEARINIDRVLAALESELSIIDYTTRDWAFWDDTYRYVRDRNQQYADTNLGEGTLETIRMNVVQFYDVEGGLVTERGYDPSPEGTSMDLAVIREWAIANLPSTQPSENSGGNRGILLLPDKEVYLIVMQPVLRSDMSGPKAGTLLMGRALDDKAIRDISSTTRLPLSYAVHSPGERTVFIPLTDRNTPWRTSVEVFNQSAIASSATIAGTDGGEILRLTVMTQRTISDQGRDIYRFFITTFCIMSVLLGGAILLILRMVVINPLDVVMRQIRAYGEDPEALPPETLKGNDELAALSTSITGMVHNIHEKDTALRHSEVQYRTIFENTGTAMRIIDRNCRTLLVNSEFERILGYRKDEIEAWSECDPFIAPEDSSRVADYFRARQVDPGSAPRQYEARILDRYGNKKSAVFTVALIPGTDLSVISLFDITGLREAEDAARQSETRFRAIVEDQSEIIIRTSPGGTVTFVNNAFCRFFGKLRGQLEGFVLRFDLPEDDKKRVDALFASLTPEHSVASIEHRVLVNGKEYWMHWNHRALFGPDGRLSEYQSVGYDITPQKRIEKARHEALDRISQNMEQFQALNDQIRNPLQGIIGIADLANGPFSERIMRHAREIDAIVNKLDRGWIESSKVREFLRKHDKGGGPG
jgi:PAS domain S-box-containing protein